MSFNWDKKTVMLLIEKFHEADMLWNPRNPNYKNRNKRMDALNKIASVFEIDKGEVERKLKNLTSHYFREKKKYEQLLKSSAGTEYVPKPKWFAYRAFHFLRDKNKPLPTIKSENDMNSQKSEQGNATSSGFRERRCSTVKNFKNLSASTPARADASVFGEYITNKIRKMDPITVSTVQNYIQNIIYKANMGIYSRPSLMSPAQGYLTTSSESVHTTTSNRARNRKNIILLRKH